MICLAFTTTGLPTSLSHMIASKNSSSDKKSLHTLFLATLYLAIIFALLLSCLIIFNSKFISSILFDNKSFYLLILTICPSIITITVSNIIRSYFYGTKNVLIPAIGQFIEQLTRIILVYLLISFINKDSFNCYIALCGIFIGEIFNILFMFIYLYKKLSFDFSIIITFKNFCNSSYIILKSSLPLTISKMFNIFIHSVSSIIVPSRLALAGINQYNSLAIFGILNGMVMPLVYLPLTIGSALVVNLIPSLSQDLSFKNHKKFNLKVKLALILGLIVGLIAFLFFYLFSDEICTTLFNNKLASVYLKHISLLPLFIILNQIISSILHTLGKELLSSFFNVCFLLLQLVFVYYLVALPNLNIFGYIYTLTIISILNFLFQFILLHKSLP